MSLQVLITGVAGFIGSNLASNLTADGCSVIGIDDLSQGQRVNVTENVQFYQLDLAGDACVPHFCDELKNTNVDTIFHFAAKNCISECELDLKDTFQKNLQTTYNALRLASALEIKQFVHAETSAFYEGAVKLPSQVGEEAPQSAYAKSKLAAAILAKQHCALNNISYFGLRYFNVYGPNQDLQRTVAPVIGAFLQCALQGTHPKIYGDGNKRRDFIHINDVNRLHRMIIDGKIPQGQYDVGTGKNHSISEIYDICSTVTKRLLSPNFEQELPGEAEQNLADGSVLEKQGFRPDISLEEGIKKQWQSMTIA